MKQYERFELAQKVIDSVTFYPNWRIKLSGIWERNIRFTVNVDGWYDADGEHPRLNVEKTTEVTFNEPLTVELMQEMVKIAFKDMERHERHEWLKFNGEHYIQPHTLKRSN